MIGTRQLEDFAARIRADGRILCEDVRRLRRLVLPHGIASRRQAEILMALDAETARADDAFSAFLAEEIARFVVWDDRPTGRLDESKVAWLRGLLVRARAAPSAAAIAAAVLEEGGAETPELAAVAALAAPGHADFGASVAKAA